MAKKGSWSRERDARKAARDSGLKDNEFEVVKGPKGYTFRKVSQYAPVPNAKSHFGKDPEASKEPIHVEVDGVPHIWKDTSTGRYRYSDESEAFSHESWETVDEANVALAKYVHEILGPSRPDPLAVESASEGVVTSPLPLIDQPVIVPVNRVIVPVETELPPVLKSEMKEEGLEPEKEELQEKPHFTEQEQDQIRKSAEESKKLEQWKKDEKLNPGTFSPDSLPKKVPVPRIHKSTIEGPSKKVWDIAEELTTANPQIKRKDVIAECVRRGIAFYTARTQYQAWLTIKRDSLAHAQEANKGSQQ